MPLAVGQTLSFYEILGPLGAGAMGEVYRAKDTRLDREVAIKVLPTHFAEDEERLKRFEREAKSLASLNHSNVAQVFGLDQTGDTIFIAMELVQGEDLGERLKRGPLPIDEAIDICSQIAEGLEAAHDAGVVHRDLKPANVRLTPDGRVKILDFGLAKHVAPGSVGDSLEDSALSTEAGRLLGTPTYMSPEQARGKPIDRRVDVWAFGCVLFECLAGERAFGGETLSDLFAAVLERGWDRSALPARTPSRVRELLERCLDKDPHTRLRDIGEARILLERTDEERPDTRLRNYRIAVVCLALLGLITGISALSGVLRPGEKVGSRDEESRNWQLALPTSSLLGWRGTSSNLSKLGGGSSLLAISGDGRQVAYCVKDDEGSSLYVHEVGGQFAGRSIPGTKDARGPFFSPGGDWLGYFAKDALQVVKVDGGAAPRKICVFSSPNFAGCWMSEDTIVYSANTGLWRVSVSTGKTQQLTTPQEDRGEVEHSGPKVLSDGDSVLFTVWTGSQTYVALLSLKTEEWHPVTREGTGAHLLPGGRLLYAQSKGLWTISFSLEGDVEGAIPEPVQEGIFRTASAGGAPITHFDVANNGTLVYAPDVPVSPSSTVSWVDHEGVPRKITEGDGIWEHPRLSPDGLSFAVDVREDLGAKDIWVHVLGDARPKKITEDGTSIMSSWSPDGDVVARSTQRQNAIRLISVLNRESSPLVELGGLDEALFADCWSKDGTVFLTCKTPSGRALHTYDPATEEKLELLGPGTDPRYSQISPDGRLLAYVRDIAGNGEVFMQPYPGMSQLVQVSSQGGGEPLWSRDGTVLYFREGQTLFAASIETDPVLRASEPVEMFTGPFDNEPGGHLHYDQSLDGEDFLMIEHHELRPDRVHVVLDWLEEIDSRP